MSKVFVLTAHGGSENQQLVDRPVPLPGAGQLGVEVRAAGVNPVDWKVRSGALGADQALPAPIGEEVSGIVSAVGDGVEDFAVGDHILGRAEPGWGGYAEHTLVAASDALLKPEEISFRDAATIPVAAAAAYDATHQIELEQGQTLLILGAGGGVGLMAAQIGRVHKFIVIGVAGESQREIVESTGATFIASGDGVPDRIREITPDGVDLIVDLVGGEPLRQVADLVADPGRIVSAADPVTVAALGGSSLNSTAEAMSKITDVIKYGLVTPHVTRTYPLEQAADALAAVENGDATGTIVIEFAGS